MSEHVAFSETNEATGLTMKIILDDGGMTESPLEHDCAVIMAALHRNYINPGEKHGLKTQEDMEAFERKNCRGKSAQWVAFPLFLYDHSGTVYRVSAPVEPGQRPVNPFSCQWDSGRLGTLFVKLSEICKRNTPRAEKLAAARKCADVTCEVYTSWANGEIYGYSIEDEEGDSLDSCWGYIGASDDEYLLQEARQAFAYRNKIALEENAGMMEAERPDLYV